MCLYSRDKRKSSRIVYFAFCIFREIVCYLPCFTKLPPSDLLDISLGVFSVCWARDNKLNFSTTQTTT